MLKNKHIGTVRKIACVPINLVNKNEFLPPICPHPRLTLRGNDRRPSRSIESAYEGPTFVGVRQILRVVGVAGGDDISVKTGPNTGHPRVTHQCAQLSQDFA